MSNYSPVNLEEARKALEGRTFSGGGRGEDIRWAGLPDVGDIKYRILPPTPGNSLPSILVFTHWNLPGDNNNNRELCFKTWNMPCPICDVLKKYANKMKIEDWESYARAYMNVLPRDVADMDPKLPYLLNASEYTHYWIIEQILDPDVGDITNPFEGRDVKFYRKKKSGPFDRKTLDKSPISTDPAEIEEILSKMYKFQEIWKTPTAEKIKEVNEIANKLDFLLTEKLNILKSEKIPSSPPAIPPNTEALNNATQPTNAGQPPVQPTSFAAPPNSRECFGTGWSDTETKCMICPEELMCKKSMTPA